MRNSVLGILRGLLNCFKQYLLAIIFAAIFFFVSLCVPPTVQNILLNISAGLFVLPLIFLSCDLYDHIRTKRQREMITIKINDKMMSIFVRFIFMAHKFRIDFDKAISAVPSFLEDRKSTLEDIFNEVSSIYHKGFFVFSYLDNYCLEIEEVLESPFILKYVQNHMISLLSEFAMHYQLLLDEFSMISKDNFILVETEDLEFSESEHYSGRYTIYNITKIDASQKNEKHIIYTAAYPIFDEYMLRGTYMISRTQAKSIATTLHALYSIINKWEKYTNTTLSSNDICIASGRLSENQTFNFHARNSVAIDINWP